MYIIEEVTVKMITQQKLSTADRLTSGSFLLKRWMSMLHRQLENFRQYLNIISRERVALEKGDWALIEKYIRQETCLVKNIEAVRKVTIPLEKLFYEQNPGMEGLLEAYGISVLQKELEDRRKKIRAGIAYNKERLERGTESLKKELQKVRKNRASRALFSRRTTPTFVDIST